MFLQHEKTERPAKTKILYKTSMNFKISLFLKRFEGT